MATKEDKINALLAMDKTLLQSIADNQAAVFITHKVNDSTSYRAPSTGRMLMQQQLPKRGTLFLIPDNGRETPPAA